MKKRFSPWKREDYHLQQLLLHQQRVIHAQQEDLRVSLLIQQRISYLENMLKAKDAEIQHLHAALRQRQR